MRLIVISQSKSCGLNQEKSVEAKRKTKNTRKWKTSAPELNGGRRDKF